MAPEQIESPVWAPHTLETAVLVLLKHHPSHGYALAGPIQELGVEVGDLTRLYRILRNLETAGIVASSWDTSAHGRGPARKIYSLTGSGHRYLRQRIQELQAKTAVMRRIEAQYADLAAGAR